MKERLKVGNRISCLIEKVELNYILASFKSAGVSYRGVLINEDCSTVKRQIPDNYYPQKAVLNDEVTENLRNEIKNRELDTTSKVLRSKKARQSCLILDDYEFTSYQDDGTTNEIPPTKVEMSSAFLSSNGMGKSPIDSIRGLVESIDSNKELSIPSVKGSLSKSCVSPETQEKENGTKIKTTSSKSSVKPKLVLDLAMQDDQYVIRKPAGFSFMGARSRLLKSPVKTLNRNSALSKVETTDQPITEETSIMEEKIDPIEPETKEENFVIKRKRFKTVKEKEFSEIRENRLRKKKKEKPSEEIEIVQKPETPPLKIKITMNKNKGKVDQPLEKVIIDDILNKTKDIAAISNGKDINKCERDADNFTTEIEKKETIIDTCKGRAKRGKGSDVETPRSKSSSPLKSESVSANSSPTSKPKGKRIDPIVIALKNIKKHDQLRRNKNLRTAGSALPIGKDMTLLRNRKLLKAIKGKKKSEPISTIRVSKRIGLKRLSKEKEQRENVEVKAGNQGTSTTAVCFEEKLHETIRSNDKSVNHQLEEVCLPKDDSPQPTTDGKRVRKKRVDLNSHVIVPTQSISEEVKLRRKLLAAKKEEVLNKSNVDTIKEKGCGNKDQTQKFDKTKFTLDKSSANDVKINHEQKKNQDLKDGILNENSAEFDTDDNGLSARGSRRKKNNPIPNMHKYKAAKEKDEETTVIPLLNKALKQVAKNKLKKASARSLRIRQLNLARKRKNITSESQNTNDCSNAKGEIIFDDGLSETVKKVEIDPPMTRGKRKARESLPLPLLPENQPSAIKPDLATSTPCSKKNVIQNMSCNDCSMIQNDDSLNANESEPITVKKVVRKKKKRRRLYPVRKSHLKNFNKNSANEKEDITDESKTIQCMEIDLESKEILDERSNITEIVEDELRPNTDNDKTHSYCKEEDDALETPYIVLSDDDEVVEEKDRTDIRGFTKDVLQPNSDNETEGLNGMHCSVMKIDNVAKRDERNVNQDSFENTLVNHSLLTLSEESDSDKQIISRQCLYDLMNSVVFIETYERRKQMNALGQKISNDSKKELAYLISNTSKQVTSDVKAPANIGNTGILINQMSSIVGKTCSKKGVRSLPIISSGNILFPKMSVNTALSQCNEAKDNLVLLPKSMPPILAPCLELGGGKVSQSVIDKTNEVCGKIENSYLNPLVTMIDSTSTSEDVEVTNDAKSIILDKVELKDIREDIRILSRNVKAKAHPLDTSFSSDKEGDTAEINLSARISEDCCELQSSHFISTNCNGETNNSTVIDLRCHENCLTNEDKKEGALSKPRKNRRKPSQVFKSLTKTSEEVKCSMTDSDMDFPVISRNTYLLGNKRTSFDIKLCCSVEEEPTKDQTVPKIMNIFSPERQYLKKSAKSKNRIGNNVDPFEFSINNDSEEEEEIEEIDYDYEESEDDKKELRKCVKNLSNRKKIVLQKKHKALSKKKQDAFIKVKRRQHKEDPMIKKEKDCSKRKFNESSLEEIGEKPLPRMSKRQRSIEQKKMGSISNGDSHKEPVSVKSGRCKQQVKKLHCVSASNVSNDEKENLSKRLSRSSVVRNCAPDIKCSLGDDDGSETSEYDQDESDVDTSDVYTSETDKISDNVLYKDKKRSTKENSEHIKLTSKSCKLSQNVSTSSERLTEDIVSLDKSHNTRFRGKKSVIPSLNLSPRKYNRVNSETPPSKLANKINCKGNSEHSIIEEEDEKKPLHFCQDIDEKSDSDIKSTNETNDSLDLNNTTNSVTKKHKKRKKKHRSFNIISYNSLLKPVNRVSNEIRTGDIVWGRCLGFGWWPGQVTSLLKSKREAYVSWHYSSTSSIMLTSELDLFLPNFKKRFAMNKTGGYVKAVIEAQKAWEEKYGVL